jgi:putative flippase GtrA
MAVTPGAWHQAARLWAGSARMRRWLAFNLVGALGVLIQLSTLAVLTGWLGLHYLLATGLAVEAALLHNFVWHENWTWSDRSRGDNKGVWKRLVRFHFANGALSIAGNIILMRFFAGTLAVSYTVANALSITVCSILNFFASDRLVFQGTRGRRIHCP